MIRIYLIGSLRNREQVQKVANLLRDQGYDVFDDWLAPGPEADDKWKEYEEGRGHSYEQSLKGWAADHVFNFDLHHIRRSDIGILVMPCGKSGHLELGYMLGVPEPGLQVSFLPSIQFMSNQLHGLPNAKMSYPVFSI